jgi:maltose alpha-D-glucosyltransferase/alpha-amylase
VATQGWYLRGAALLGKRTAELHLALAAAKEPAFVPERLDADALHAMAAGMEAHAHATFELLGAQIATLPELLKPHAERLLDSRATLGGRFTEFRELRAAGMRIRIHGDYHLGQVLRTEEDFYVLDLEGEPARTLAERRAKQSPLKDVAGMVRSYSYAAYAALFAFALHAPDDFDTLEPWAREWHRWVADSFVREYRTTIGRSSIVPGPEDESFDVMLRALTLDKALYELAYELNNRPEWVRIPLVGLLTLVP